MISEIKEEWSPAYSESELEENKRKKQKETWKT